MPRLTVVLTLLFPLLLLVVPVGAAEAPRTVDTQAVRIALFKNGLAFFIRSGELPDQAGPITVGPLPAAVHGTFWLSYDRGVELRNLSAAEVKATEMREAVTLAELLRANVGRRMRLEVAGAQPQTIEGVLKYYPEQQVQPMPNPYLAAPIAPPDGRRMPGDLLMIETKQGLVALSAGSIARVVFAEEPVRTVPQELSRIALRGELVQGMGRGVTASYLTKGMTWVPSYLLDISAEKEGTLSAKAEIINEIEDLEGVEVELITGFPYLEFSEIISPLAKKENLAAFLNALSSGASTRTGRREYGALAQQVMFNVPMGPAGPAGPGMPGPTPEYGAVQAGEAAEDLFFYPVAGVTLAKDAVGYYPLFTEKAPYSHLYTWELPDYVDARDYYQRPPEETRQIVWHQLLVTNGTRIPWTTAPVTVMQKERVLAQSMLTYTPAGGEVRVKITQALQIRAEETELETGREVNVRLADSFYDRVTLEGRLLLKNFKQEAVKVRTSKLLTGTVKATTPEAKVETLGKGLRSVNPRSRLAWELTLEPGQEQEMTYTYEVLLRR